jgi:hypothetical protein
MAKINFKTEMDVDELYECLSYHEKYELSNKLIEDKQYDLDNFYYSLNSDNKTELRDKLYNDNFLIQPEYDNDDIKKYLIDNDKFNDSILKLLGKSHMLTYGESEWLIGLSEKYKYFD